MVTRVTTAPAYQATRRRIRSPKHTFNLRHKPYAIQPFMIAPVLPGETMKNLLMQSRVVSDPVKSPLVGWWLDYLYVYVKHRDLDVRDTLTDMMLNPEFSMPVEMRSVAENRKLNTYAGAVDWTRLCLEKIVFDHFRNEGEEVNQFTVDGLPSAGINQESFLNSLVMGEILDEDIDVDANADGTITASEVDQALRQWQLLRMHNLTEMSYEDWLRTYGVRASTVELHRTEIVRVIREWTYPTNTVNPETGAPTTAVSYSIQERADKDRYFKEPGFLVGVTVARPKVYLGNIKGSGVGMMDSALRWLPALMHEDHAISLARYEEGTGPLPVLDDTNNGYWIDVRDLLIYGDQFVNHTSDDANVISLPAADGNHRYATGAMADSLFAGDGKNFRQDGIVTLAIAGRQVDTTPGTPVQPA